MTTDDPRGREVPHGGQTPHECGDSHVDVEWPALTPCPFCGGHVDESDWECYAYRFVVVECPDCGASAAPAPSRREAIEAWERRAVAGDTADRVRDLEAQLAEFDAAPVTDARIWDSVRDRIAFEVSRVNTGHYSFDRSAFVDRLTTIALGEREEP